LITVGKIDRGSGDSVHDQPDDAPSGDRCRSPAR
jgi:hypothetical protein